MSKTSEIRPNNLVGQNADRYGFKSSDILARGSSVIDSYLWDLDDNLHEQFHKIPLEPPSVVTNE